jgi:hypothetical protein
MLAALLGRGTDSRPGGMDTARDRLTHQHLDKLDANLQCEITVLQTDTSPAPDHRTAEQSGATEKRLQ